MGINLGGLVARRTCDLADLAGQRVAIDAHNALYQFITSIRQADGTPLTDARGRTTSHLYGLLQRTAYLLGLGVRPAYVFDGPPHELKRATLLKRRRIKEAAEAAREAAIKKGDMETARAKAQQAAHLSTPMIKDSIRLLERMGVPCVQAPREGEAQAAVMARAGLVDVVASQDYDSVLFGAPLLVRNVSIGSRRKMPGRMSWTEAPPETIALDETLAGLELTRAQLVDLALLMGTDFNPGVTGIGPKTALKLIKENGTIEAALGRAEKETKGAVWKNLRSGVESVEPLATLRKMFLEPPTGDLAPLKWGAPDESALRSMLTDDYGFSTRRLDTALEKVRAGRTESRQQTIGDF